jgi:hypothetical protein
VVGQQPVHRGPGALEEIQRRVVEPVVHRRRGGVAAIDPLGGVDDLTPVQIGKIGVLGLLVELRRDEEVILDRFEDSPERCEVRRHGALDGVAVVPLGPRVPIEQAGCRLDGGSRAPAGM